VNQTMSFNARPLWWLGAVLGGFWLAWPVGLVVLGYLAVTGKLAAFRQQVPGQWFNVRSQARAFGASFGGAGFGGSGNQAFDTYRADTLRRLEEEQAEFVQYLERLRQARDKAEFDQFMAERGRNRAPVQTQDQAA